MLCNLSQPSVSLSTNPSGSKMGPALSMSACKRYMAQGQAHRAALREQAALKTTSTNGGEGRQQHPFLDSLGSLMATLWPSPQHIRPETSLPVCHSHSHCQGAREELSAHLANYRCPMAASYPGERPRSRWLSILLEKSEIRQVVAGFKPCVVILTNIG